MGSRLRKRKLERIDVKLAIFGGRRKGLGGVGGLTGNAIDSIQSCYSWIIRSNTGNIEKMHRFIMAMYDHISSTDAEPKHEQCEPTICKYLIAKSNNQPYIHHGRQHFHIPPSVMEHVKDIFVDLAKPELLKKCVDGKTQNANECLNSTIWNFLPKNGFGNRPLIEFGVFMALCIFNEGYAAVLDVLKNLGWPVGAEMTQKCEAADTLRIKRRRSQSKMDRTKRRSTGAEDQDDDQYQSGLCE